MSSHHPPRHCFTHVDFDTLDPFADCYFTDGHIYRYDFTRDYFALTHFQLDPSGHNYNQIIRGQVPSQRIR